MSSDAAGVALLRSNRRMLATPSVMATAAAADQMSIVATGKRLLDDDDDNDDDGKLQPRFQADSYNCCQESNRAVTGWAYAACKQLTICM